MIGDEQGEAEPGRARAPEQAEPGATVPAGPQAAKAASGIADPMASRPVSDFSLGDPSATAFQTAEPRDVPTAGLASDTGQTQAERGGTPGSFYGPIAAILGVAVVILLGALAYLFSTMPDGSRLAALDTAVADLKSQVASLQSRPAPPDVAPLAQRLDAAEKQLVALQARPEAPPSAAVDAAQLDPLAAKIGDLQRTLDADRAGVDQSRQESAALGSRLDALQGKVDALPKLDLAPLTAQLDGIDGRLKPLEAEAQAAKNADRVTAARQNGTAAESRAAPLAVTAQAVLRAIDAGRPFAEDLKALQSLGAKAEDVQPLAAVAPAGAPTTKDLRADLAAVRDGIANQAAPAPTGSYVDRLMAGAAGLVRVRPLGSVVGDTPAAILARMDEDLAKDDLAAALAEWQKLPEASRNLGKGLADRIRLRQAAQESARAIGAEAIRAMASAQP